MNLKKIFLQGGSLLHITFMAGIILFLAAAFILSISFFINRSQTREERRQDSFHRILREYDISVSVFTGTQREMEILNSELDRLEKRAIGVESWLSILKRRRALANMDPSFTKHYHDSIFRSRKVYPGSQSLAAIGAAAIVKDTAITEEKETELRSLLALLTDSSYNTLQLNLHILLGDFHSPRRAAAIPYNFFSEGPELIKQNLIILKILERDIRLAAAELQGGLNSSPSPDFIRFAAEFHYDFGELERSAELFSKLDDDQALIRQADALYLAGFQNSARSIWTLLSQGHIKSERSLYNLSVTSQNSDEALLHLETLVNTNSLNTDIRIFGLIRYSRLFLHDRALALLQNDEFLNPSQHPFLDLEICKRNSLLQEPRRRIAEAWLLMDRHIDNEDIFWWSAWVMSANRFYGELEILLKRPELNQFTNFSEFYTAIFLMQQGHIDEAEKILRSIPKEDMDWTIHANLGRILEARLSHARALEEYEIAAMLTRNPKAASRIFFRMARCFSAIGRASDAVLALENALLFDPENLSARMELNRTF